MKYLIYILILVVLTFSFFLWKKIQNNIKISLFKKLLSKNIQQTQYNTHLSLFHNIITDIISKFFIKASKKEQTKILKSLEDENIQTLLKFLQKKDLSLEYALKHILSFKANSKKIQKKKNRSSLLRLLSCIIHESNFSYSAIKNDLPGFFWSKRYRAIRNLLHARYLFFKTDLKNALKYALKASKTLKKERLNDELAYTYFMIGEIYRIAGEYDLAHMTFLCASKIYQTTNHIFGQNLILANLGINCTHAKRFKDAELYFNQALTSFRKNKDILHEAEILNQKALLLNIKSDPLKAYKTAQEALQKNKKIKNEQGLALSFQQMAIALYSIEKFNDSLKAAQEAKKRYLKQKNYQAYADSLDLLTQIYLKTGRIHRQKNH